MAAVTHVSGYSTRKGRRVRSYTRGRGGIRPNSRNAARRAAFREIRGWSGPMMKFQKRTPKSTIRGLDIAIENLRYRDKRAYRQAKIARARYGSLVMAHTAARHRPPSKLRSRRAGGGGLRRVRTAYAR